MATSSSLSSSDTDTSEEWTDFRTPKKRRYKSTVHGLNRRRANYYRSKSRLNVSIEKNKVNDEPSTANRQFCEVTEVEVDLGENAGRIGQGSSTSPSASNSDMSCDSASLSISSSNDELSSDNNVLSGEDFEENQEYGSSYDNFDDSSRDCPIFEGCPHSVTSLYTMLMLYAIKHSLSKEAFADLTGLVKSVFPTSCTLNVSVYKIKEHLRKTVNHTEHEVHFFCETCQMEVTAGGSCENCDRPAELEYHNLNVEEQIKDLFKDEHFCKILMGDRHYSMDGHLADISDGSEYKKLIRDQSGCQTSNTVQLSLLMNTDGVAVYSSSKKGSLWPVYLAINELPIALRFSRRYLLPCLLFCQPEKPNMLTYLATLMQTLLRFQEGIEIDTVLGKRIIKGHLLAVCVDLPARAMVLNMKQFNGKYGCNVCLAEGATQPNCPLHRYYPFEENTPRCHETMLHDAHTAVESGEAVKGIKGGCALLALKYVDLTTICPPDWMHCVLLGVVKALLKLWLSPSNKNREFYIGDKMALINKRLLHIQVPDFIARRPSSVSEHAHWKATECREWLINFSIPVLSGLLNDTVSVHYSLLVCAMTLLTKEVVTEADIEVADELLKDFCALFPDIYGITKQSMNVHMLTHLSHFVRLFGPLWNFSCFGFESMNAHLKNMIHGTRHINHQISCAIAMTRCLPALVKDIVNRTQNNTVRRLAKNLSSKITMVETEADQGHFQVLGSRKILKDHPAVKKYQLHGPVHKFHRCSTEKGQLWSEEYQRAKTRNSYTICCRYGDRTRYGSILYFLDYDKHLFAVVKLFYDTPFTLQVDFDLLPNQLQKYRGMIFKHIVVVSESNDEVLVPVELIYRKCILMNIDHVKYIAVPPNMCEHS